MGYCKHQWQDRTQVLREVFKNDPERRTHEFFVCATCLRINERAAVTIVLDDASRPAEAA